MPKTVAGLALLALLAAPLVSLAQDAQVMPVEDTASTEAPAEEAAPATDSVDSASGPDASADATSPETAEASGESSSGTTDSTDTVDAGGSGDSYDSSGSGGEEPASQSIDEEEHPNFYVAIDRAEARIDLSDDGIEDRFGTDELDGGFYRGHLGWRLIPGVAIEGLVGFAPDKAKAVDEFEMKKFYGAYIVPTGTVLDVLEISGRFGYSWSSAEAANGAEKSFSGVSYGAELLFPIRVISKSLPNLRLTAGGTVFYQDRDARTMAWHYGLRYDFRL
ncbi:MULTISPECIES: hypothetical protein [Hydrocarboniphaga]|jgi:hypothetical protein|uniref:Outer membrane protein beta-barrel domain-containing protein n=1 Tax=Hydrocarboniphaga effusa AP103 TaxID=1172194 RepID=I7ZEA9_9GAMM|nr:MULTISPECIES: hypothetical protein [Hydrocarboniphaga]EIT70012.1 hypothetical protein WQQ_01490 [Hydrocarboniphaga effusa AP103]EIT70199.1 hypothetical protein WQQ_03360 [Hydrocarboniphaga effusa AP103]MDZ4077171.1 hypothetical protein [Hydrocarboniphaga sp.]